MAAWTISAIQSFKAEKWHKEESKGFFKAINMNLVIAILLLTQWDTLVLALEDIESPDGNSVLGTINLPGKDIVANQTIDSGLYESIEPKLTPLKPKHSHIHKPPAKLTGPLDLSVNTTTPTSITLQWQLNERMKSRIIKYRIHYVHQNFEDVKTFVPTKYGMYELTELDPFTMYNISLEGIVDGDISTRRSNQILAHTDVGQPGPPLNVTVICLDTGSLYVEWLRPQKHGLRIDAYKIYYRQLNQPHYDEAIVSTAPDAEISKFVIGELQGGRNYEVQVCAGTKSLSNLKVAFGDMSQKVSVYLPLNSCEDNRRGVAQELSAGMIGGAVCAVLFLMLAIIGFILWRQYFKAAYYYLDEPHRTISSVGGGSMPNWEDEPGPDGGTDSGAVQLKDFPEHVAKLHEDSDFGFSKEYDEIQKYCLKCVKATHEHSSHIDNKCKNRYLNIVAYDHSRVKLLPLAGQKKTSDYINANYIDGFQKCNAYIGTQGPLEDTLEAFWRMVWEQNVYVIVMITNLMERGRRKCDIYWPKDDTEIYGQIEAQLENEEIMADYTIRTIKLRHLKECGEKVTNVSTLKKKKSFVGVRIVKQFHYTSWPDHGVPCHTLPSLTFVRKSSEANPQPSGNHGSQGAGNSTSGGPAGDSAAGILNSAVPGTNYNTAASNVGGGPIVVHCSAGVGRTGTYIAIDTMLQQVKAKGKFNIYGFLKHIRTQRNYLVQTEEQYVFIHDALLEAMASGTTEIHREKLGDYIKDLQQETAYKWNEDRNGVGAKTEKVTKDDKQHQNGVSRDELTFANSSNVDDCDVRDSKDLEAEEFQGSKNSALSAQFELITGVKPSEYQYLSARKECNLAKNRNPELVPIESHRIALSPKPGTDGSDYINASWLCGHNKLKEFILTQHPTIELKEDFWRMLWDHNAQTVVLLSLSDTEDLPIFWPTKEDGFDFETFRVRFIEEAIHEGHSTFDLVVSSQHDDYELAVRIIHCPEWHKMHNLIQAFSVLKLVQDWHLEYQDGPLVVVDRDGGTEAATFCALTTLCKQLDYWHSMDVYQVAKLYHNKRPGIWRSPDDILYLYKAVETLVNSKDISNPLQDAGPSTSTDFPATASSSEGGGTATTIEMVVGENTEGPDSSEFAINERTRRRHSESASASSTVATECCNVELGNNSAGETRRHSLPSSNDESQPGDLKETSMTNLPPLQPTFNFDSSRPSQPLNSSPSENSPESFALQSQVPSLEAANSNSCSNNTANLNECAIAIQVDEDYDEEENEDEISETVALTQKFDKSRIKKN